MVSRNKDGGGDYMPWGGQTLFCLNAEYTVPIVKYLRIAVFSDMGAVGEDEFDFDFSDNFAWTAGVGFRIDIASNLDEESILSILVHEFSHYIH